MIKHCNVCGKEITIEQNIRISGHRGEEKEHIEYNSTDGQVYGDKVICHSCMNDGGKCLKELQRALNIKISKYDEEVNAITNKYMGMLHKELNELNDEQQMFSRCNDKISQLTDIADIDEYDIELLEWVMLKSKYGELTYNIWKKSRDD
jgi:hypothetical protein